jgi:hypothetical protein
MSLPSTNAGAAEAWGIGIVHRNNVELEGTFNSVAQVIIGD